MKKNYFKFLMAIAMMLGGVSLTSCDEMLDNPVEEPTEQTEEPKIVETETGAEITINALSDISGLLGELTPMIEAKNGEEFVLDVKSNGSLKVTETDNIILVPNVAGCNLVINFDNSLVSDGSAVTMKLDSKAATRAMVDENGVVYDKNVALNLKNTNTDLILDVPGVTVTVSTLNSIQVLNGLSIVKEGASINTYVYAPKSNDVALYNGAAEDVQVNWINDETGEKEGWGTFPAVRSLKEWQYHFKNIKVIKGKADYARIEVGREENKLDKLTIADGVTVLLNQTPQIKEIVGEGNQTAKIQFDWFWGSYTDADGNEYYQNNGFLTNVEKISNIIIDEYSNDFYKSTKNSYLGDVPADVENVIFKFSEINFRNPEAATASVKNCKFESANKDYRRARITVPYQSTEISSFKFTFDNCEFSDEFKISASINSSKPVIDEEGNPVWVYYYEYREEGKGWISFEVASFEDIPEEAKEKDGFSWWMGQKYEPVTYKDYYATIAFIDCKYADKALTPETSFFDYSWTPDGAYIRYEFDGKVYRAIRMYDPEKEGDKYTWMLVEVND